MTFALSSPAFAPDGPIPRRHTCDGEDRSPALRWGDAPPATKSFALICDDPDAPCGTWVHWVICNLPASSHELPEGISREPHLSDGSIQGQNSWGKPGYNGPCPPRGKPHRYYFQLYALDVVLALDARASKPEVLEAMRDHILAEARLMGTYAR